MSLEVASCTLVTLLLGQQSWDFDPCNANRRESIAPAVAVQIYYSNKATASEDLTFSIWEVSIAAQLVQCLAILTVCVPNFKPFLDSLESGQIRVDDLRRQGKSSNNSYPTNDLGHSGSKSAYSWSRPQKTIDAAAPTSSDTMHNDVHELTELGNKSVDRGVSNKQKASWDGQSHKSHSSQTILIHQTWQVEVENLHRKTDS